MSNSTYPIAIVSLDGILLYHRRTTLAHIRDKGEAVDGELLGKKLNDLFLNRVKPDGRPYTHQEVAEATGLGPSTISRLRSGKENNPAFNTIYKLARFFGVPISFFADDMADSVFDYQEGEGVLELNQIAFRSLHLDQRDLDVITEMLKYIAELKQEFRDKQDDTSADLD
jgi:transcriptional regulator with XRE-family HTH domain